MERLYYYDKIMNLYGMEHMKKVVKKWDIVSESIRGNKELPIVLPNLLWRTKSGIGKTYFMEMLAHYLSGTHLMSFYGQTKLIEFQIDYCHEDMDFIELRRLMQMLDFATGSRGNYKGLLSLELDLWVGHFDTKYFHQLMSFLTSRDNDLCIIFILENVEEDVVRNLENILAGYMRVDTIISEYPKTEAFLGYVQQWLGRYDFKVEADALKVLDESIEKLKKSDHFDGFNTLNLMCEDIVFEILAEGKLDVERCISSKDLRRYSIAGTFITKLEDVMNKRQIGFVHSGGADE